MPVAAMRPHARDMPMHTFNNTPLCAHSTTHHIATSTHTHMINRSEQRDGFDPAQVGMTEAQASDLALRFAQYGGCQPAHAVHALRSW